MYNDAKKASNNRYLSKFKPVSLRVLPEELEAIQAAAAAAGLSAHAFILGAVRARLGGPAEEENTATGCGLLSPAAEEIARAAADRAGLEPEAWVTAAVQEQSARDARAEELRRLLANKEKN